MTRPLHIVVIGLSLSSSWGNGHATTYRALLKSLAARGHQILFLERDSPWYAAHRDLTRPDFCRLELYESLSALRNFQAEITAADAVIVGSYVPDGIEIGIWIQETARGVTAFYDIDTPVTLAELDQGRSPYISLDLVRGYNLYLSFSGGPVLESLELNYGAPAARALYCSVDTAAYHPLPLPLSYDLGYLGTYSDDRQSKLERLLLEPARRCPGNTFVVAGPLYPPEIEWPSNVHRIEHVAPADHPKFYSMCRFTLNLTRAAMIRTGYSPSIRLFEAAACGAPIISDAWPGLDEFFQPDEEILVAETAEEIVALLSTPLSTSRRIGRAGRQAILSSHTAEHRAIELESFIAELVDSDVDRPALSNATLDSFARSAL